MSSELNAAEAAAKQISATITAERQRATHQVAAVMNSMFTYLGSLAHKAEDGTVVITDQLKNACERLSEASHWALQHVIENGIPTKPAANDEPPAKAAQASTPIEGVASPAPVVGTDANGSPTAELPTNNASGTEAV